MIQPFDFQIPTTLHFGNGVFAKTPKLAATLGKHALLVTSRQAVHQHGYVDELSAGLKRQGLAFTCYRNISPGPTTDEIDAGAHIAKEINADIVIALGGGSALDGGKAIAAVACSNARAVNFLEGHTSVQDALPIVAVPTTSGTGSEMNKSAMIRDLARPFKDGIRSPRLYPRFAVVDPRLTTTVPYSVTASTGFDALSHAIESFVSPRAQPIADGLALAAIGTIRQWLPEVLSDLENLEGRAHLSYASTTMGINLASVGTCLPHRIDKALCALHPEIPHGRSVAMAYPAWGEMSCLSNIERFAQVVDILTPGLTCSPRAKATRFSDSITDFLSSLQMNQRLGDFGVTAEDIPRLVERTPGNLRTNPTPVSKDDLPRLLLRMLHA